ncbi:MAG: hypothetical protein A2Z20_08805 [Bdellovibrionales bacterium RBG_16_40_8]|nr:MAG: hypothetical protein A2Z20_08805 [Bdellovibrionales bacterium RBG_16_40_8]
MTDIVNEFFEEIKSINDYDYGDFKRKANDCILRLKNNLAPFAGDNIHHKLSEMQMYTQFLPSGEDVAVTKKRLLNDAKYLQELLAAKKQDCESAPRSVEL